MIYDLQKASILKRVSAWLLDFICITIIAAGAFWLISAISKFDAKSERYEEIITQYGEQYGIDLKQGLDQDATQQQKDLYNQAYEAFAKDEEAIALYSQIINITILMVSLGLFVAVFVVEFVVPLFLKNGQTLGKKIFSVAVMQVSGVRITPFILFVRAILGKYTIELMVPAMILAMAVMGVADLITLLVLGALVVFQIVLVIATKNNSLIHDALSSTVAVDMATQMIFDNKEEMIKYKEEQHKAEVERSEYDRIDIVKNDDNKGGKK